MANMLFAVLLVLGMLCARSIGDSEAGLNIYKDLFEVGWSTETVN